uniref:Uncharacterized protein n=1 Tax=Arundo donax TaxID=35708 RepID=A0A0A8ZI23_ARUDO
MKNEPPAFCKPCIQCPNFSLPFMPYRETVTVHP